MSRTDKDTPSWVRALHDPNARVHHSWLCETSRYGMARPDLARPCDLHETVNRRTNACYYWADDRTDHCCGITPSADRLHHNYYGPERTAVRDSLRNALRDYNTYGDTDIEAPTRQTRSATWAGGRWC